MKKKNKQRNENSKKKFPRKLFIFFSLLSGFNFDKLHRFFFSFKVGIGRECSQLDSQRENFFNNSELLTQLIILNFTKLFPSIEAFNIQTIYVVENKTSFISWMTHNAFSNGKYTNGDSDNRRTMREVRSEKNRSIELPSFSKTFQISLLKNT